MRSINLSQVSAGDNKDYMIISINFYHNNNYNPTNILWVNKSSKTKRSAGGTKGKMGGECEFSGGNSKGKKTLSRPRRRWEDNS
jgi:hypothetical protein